MNVDIKLLVEETPNDQELGEKIRKIYWDISEKKIVNITNQLNIFDEINKRPK